jgi:hypothetical protein
MLHNDSPSLPGWVREAYGSLEPHFETTTDGLSRSKVEELLLSDADVVEESSDAVYVVDRLLDRGWVYEVDGTLYKTE